MQMPVNNNPLHNAIRQKIVEPALNERVHTLKGKVVEYDNITNTAVVEIPNPTGRGLKTIAGVPIQIMGGYHHAGPFKGDHVWVGFMGGNIYHPRIISIADETYANKTRSNMRHKRQGVFIPDSYTR